MESSPKRTYVTHNNRVTIEYEKELDGGGTWLAPAYVCALDKYYSNRTFSNGLEWCSGPGFIGFEIMSRDICTNFDFMDLHQPALDNIKTTIKNNNLTQNIECLLSDEIGKLPAKKYDLIVGNPPHYTEMHFLEQRSSADCHRRTMDIDLEIHKEFFKNIINYLTDDGVIITSGTYIHRKHYDIPEIGIHFHRFYPLIRDSGLKLIDVHVDEGTVNESYYMVLEKKR